MEEYICPKCRREIRWAGDEHDDDGAVYGVYTCEECYVEVLVHFSK